MKLIDVTKPACWIVASVLLSVSGCGDQSPPPQADHQGTPQDVELATQPAEQPVEHLQVVELKDIESIIAQTAQDDRVLVIDFWATWCVPCVEMFPELHAGLVSQGDRVRTMTVTLDDPSREAQAIAFLSDQHALTDAYIFKSDSAAQQALIDGLGDRWSNLAVPAILVYDPNQGLVGEFLEGGTAPQIIELVKTLLASDPLTSDQEAQP